MSRPADRGLSEATAVFEGEMSGVVWYRNNKCKLQNTYASILPKIIGITNDVLIEFGVL